MAFEVMEKGHEVPPLEPSVFLADAYVHVCVSMFVCDLLQGLGRIQKARASSAIRSWISFSLPCHSSPLCLPLILLSSKVKKRNVHITLSSQQKQLKNVSDENNIL